MRYSLTQGYWVLNKEHYMSELNFPKNPAIGQEYLFNTLLYKFDGVKWVTKGTGYNPVQDLYEMLASDAGAAFIGEQHHDSVQAALDQKTDVSQFDQSGVLTTTAAWTDVPAFSDPVLGGPDGSMNAQAKALVSRSELLRIDVYEALRRTYAEAGYSLVAGSFEKGGVITDKKEVLLFESEGVAYSWGGALPKTVSPNSTPSSSGGIGAAAWTNAKNVSLRSQLGTIYLADLPGVTTDGTTDCAAALNALLTEIRAIPSKQWITQIKGQRGHIYLFNDWIDCRDITGIDIDLCGATVVDNVQGLMPGVIVRSKPLFVSYNSKNTKFRNCIYTVTPTRGNMFPTNSVVTAALWAGGQQLGPETTREVEFSGIYAFNQTLPGGMLVAGAGELNGFTFKDIYMDGGDWGYGFNLEWGEPAPTDPAIDTTNTNGRHPHNGVIENFNGANLPDIVTFMRFASCYNVEVKNCEMFNMQKGIEYYSGDKGISRYSQNVTFKNVKFKTNLTRAINGVSIFAPDVLNAVPLPSWTNYDHFVKFDHCEFQGNTNVQSSGLRFLGCDGKVKFEGCKFSGWYRAHHIDNSAQVTYLLEDVLIVDSCEFKDNAYDNAIGHISNVTYRDCTFKNQNAIIGAGLTSDTCPIQIGTAATRIKYENCSMRGIIAGRRYINIDAAAVDTRLDDNVFRMGDAVTPAIFAASRVYGLRNASSSNLIVGNALADKMVRGDAATGVKSLDGAVAVINRDNGDMYLSTASGTSLTTITNGIVGDHIIFRGGGGSSSVTFQHAAAAVPTSQRLLLKTGANETMTGANWAKEFVCFATGWYEI